MAKRPFKTNIGGRVNKIKTRDFLVPLFEALSNSIHAIESVRRKGSIQVHLLREPRQGEIPESRGDAELPVTGFVITDNGVGFTSDNMESFCEADSPFKASLGGKGVGRFSWLKFFERATVESVFVEAGKTLKRTFTFSVGGIDEEPIVEVTSAPQTTVSLTPLHTTYEPKTRKSLGDIAIAVVEHFIAYFVTEAMPTLMLHDGAATQDVGDLYRSSIGKHASRHEFTLNGNRFEAVGIKFFLGSQSHMGFLCADKRVSDKIQLGKRDHFFSKRFTDEDLRAYAFQIFVQSEYLDRIVHDDREGFRFPEPGTFEARSSDAVTRDDIADQLLAIAHETLANEIQKLKVANLQTVTSFVSTDAPQYRRLVARNRAAVENIHENDRVRIDQVLRRLQFEEELKTRSEVGALLRKAEEVGATDDEEWTKKSAEILEKLSEEGKASLSAYIVQRKMILELLEKRMEVTAQHHAREEAVHRLIFPMRSTSDEVSYENQNLWMIDERLSYHYYLASDKPLSSIPPANSDSTKEPDIIVFNRPIALNDRQEGERLESIVIIEFKRPGESSVEGQKNPVQQIQEYIELILSNRAESRRGRQLLTTNATYFFGYVICELDPLLKKVLKRLNMRETPDGRGMYNFFEEHRAYIEVISYEKMIDDAKKRNRILFDKLQLPL